MYQSISDGYDSLKPAELNSSENIIKPKDMPPNTTVFKRSVKTQIEG